MIFSYDNDADALYIAITDSPIARTRRFDKGTIVDLDESGQVVGNRSAPAGAGLATGRDRGFLPPRERQHGDSRLLVGYHTRTAALPIRQTPTSRRLARSS